MPWVWVTALVLIAVLAYQTGRCRQRAATYGRHAHRPDASASAVAMNDPIADDYTTDRFDRLPTTGRMYWPGN
jgi:hypothetical protein